MLNKRIYIVIIILGLTVLELTAIPAWPYPIKKTLPDGTKLTILLQGDEFNKTTTTIDGYLIKENKVGFFNYIISDTSGKLITSERIARDKELRSTEDELFLLDKAKTLQTPVSTNKSKQKIPIQGVSSFSSGFPRTGSPKSLVILINFSDNSFVTPTPQDAFHRLLNEEFYSENGGTGSVGDYFRAASYGQFNPQFDVVGPYTLPYTMEYYGANNTDGNDLRPAYMVVDACKAANANLDFSQYDSDGDGYIDNVFIYYAGYNEAEGAASGTVWPHRWAVQPGVNFTNNQTLVRFDGKTVFDYACTSELKGNTGTTMCGIGTFTHEFGHVIGMPDYYHTEYPSKKTLQSWSVMDLGAYLNQGRTPPQYSAYDRFFMGWLTPEELTSASDNELHPLSQMIGLSTQSGKQAYLLSASTHNLQAGNPSPQEFYIMEYRKKMGWDSFLPSEGLLFWHIDYDQTEWDNNTLNNYSNTVLTADSHMRVYLQPLSGYSSTPGTAFVSGSFDPVSWNGVRLDREVTDIQMTDSIIRFKLMGGEPSQSTSPAININTVYEQLIFPDTRIGNEQIKTLKINTVGLSSDLTITISGNHADLFISSVNLLRAIDTNSKGGALLSLHYKPLTAGEHQAVLTLSGGELEPTRTIILQARATE